MRTKHALWRLGAILAMALLGSALISGSAMAQSATATFQVQANVPDLCNISATNMDFGVYDPLSATDDDDGQSTVTINCTPGTSYDVALNDGLLGTRQLDNGTDLLTYELYQDATRLADWGNTVGTDTQGGTFVAGPPVNYSVYGRIPALQTVNSTGTYSDTVTAEVFF
jgi:spore coat protein U-like protein